MERSRRRRSSRRKVRTALLLFLLLLLGVGLLKFGHYIPILFGLFSKDEIKLQRQTPDKKINLLLLGVGGGRHDGPNLTDTIIFAHIDPTAQKVTLASIPRDLWVPELDAKINSAYTDAEDKKQGSGLAFTKDIVQKIINQQIDYAVKIDFQGFVKAVDMAGGLDVNVENTFDDYAYPLSGKEEDTCGLSEDQIASLSAEIASGSATEGDSFPCRYEHLHFDKGMTHMDGETALKFVRSRHSMGKEGSDFARSKRQEKVIQAFKDKIFSPGTLMNPVKVMNLLTILQDSITTDIKEEEYDEFARLAQKMKESKITSAIIDTGDEAQGRFGLLINPPIGPEYNNAWVLSPRLGNGDYKEIQTYIMCTLKETGCLVGKTGIVTPTPTPTASPKPSGKSN